jgi:hypothetical protein
MGHAGATKLDRGVPPERRQGRMEAWRIAMCAMSVRLSIGISRREYSFSTRIAPIVPMCPSEARLSGSARELCGSQSENETAT